MESKSERVICIWLYTTRAMSINLSRTFLLRNDIKSFCRRLRIVSYKSHLLKTSRIQMPTARCIVGTKTRHFPEEEREAHDHPGGPTGKCRVDRWTPKHFSITKEHAQNVKRKRGLHSGQGRNCHLLPPCHSKIFKEADIRRFACSS